MGGLTVGTLLIVILALAAIVSVLQPKVPLGARLKRILVATVLAAASVFLGVTAFLLTAFHAFTNETLVAQVTTRRISPEEFELSYTPAPASATRLMRLRGDQWSIGGGIVKWHPWLTILGLHSYHKPLRISGRFSDIAREIAQPPSVYALVPEVDRFWEALYWMDPYLPFVDAVYGSAVYAYAEPRIVEVYATPTGYLIRRKK
ncbi:MAG: hypothetical protein HYT88_00225 [Candidatus Omnitrophica bacterium]|nr:hypothetical protein [Candidatus Omnitrophota bacterium]MBI3010045.1 hypothetical protein [Candidatus Omnitrophota bacterium]